MNEDYLWDKTGEADPEIERLEQKLSSLRFKRPAEPLPLPAAAPRRFFGFNFQTPALAAAAALLVLLLAGGLWLSLRGRGTTSTAGQSAPAATAPPVEKQGEKSASGSRPPIGPQLPPNAVDPRALEAGAGRPDRQTAPGRSTGGRRLVARRAVPRRVSPRQEELARRGEEAKAQLIKALHLASDKLNEVQKKIQAGPDEGPTS